MRRLVTIDLRNADLAVFEAYEATVLRLLQDHGAKLDARVRSVDGAMETHLLTFPDGAAYGAYLADPRRIALHPEAERSGARFMSVEVKSVG